MSGADAARAVTVAAAAAAAAAAAGRSAIRDNAPGTGSVTATSEPQGTA
jgi:hypothetical protein